MKYNARSYQIAIIASRVDQLEEYHDRIERFAGREIASLQRQFDDGVNELSDEERSERADFYSDEHELLSRVFVRTLRASVLVAAYTLLETSLDAVCIAEQKRHGYSVALPDLAHTGIFRAKLYLTKVCGMGFPKDTQEWARLVDLNQIRNAAAHADGNIGRLRHPEAIRGVISGTEGLRLRNETYLEIDRGYVTAITRDIRSFFSLLYKAFPR